MKLMYMAERMSLERYTASITDATFKSMKNGPVLLEVVDLFSRPYGIWKEHIEFSHFRDNGDSNTVSLAAPLDVSEFLSIAEIAMAEEVWLEFGKKGKWALVDIVHEFPEWDREARDRDTCLDLSLGAIFSKGLGKTEHEAQERAKEIEYYRRVLA